MAIWEITSLIDLDGEACLLLYSLSDGCQLLFFHFYELFLWGGAVEAVDHDLAWIYTLICLDKSGNLFFRGVVYRFAVVGAAQDHCLYDAGAFELAQGLYYPIHCKSGRIRSVYKAHCALDC